MGPAWVFERCDQPVDEDLQVRRSRRTVTVRPVPVVLVPADAWGEFDLYPAAAPVDRVVGVKAAQITGH